MLSFFVDWLFGYVRVKITGGVPERFLNLCSVSGKDVWGYRRTEDGILLSVRVSEYRSLRPLARRAGVRLHLLSRHGAPFLAVRIRKRPGLIIGLAVFALVLCISGQRIWQIEIHGNQKITDQQVLSMLEHEGVAIGMANNGTDFASLRQKILAENKGISWMSINPEGTVLQVDISESVSPPDRIRNDQPCNVVAQKDGVIAEILPNIGTPLVKVGDAVVKGDVLISGVVEYADGCTVLRHADGKVTAETVTEKQWRIPYVQQVVTKTGQCRTRRLFHLFGLHIPLYVNGVQPPYTTRVQSRDLTVQGVTLPMGIKTVQYYPTRTKTVRYTARQAREQGQKKLHDYLKKLNKTQTQQRVIPAETESSDAYVLQVKIVGKEIIGKTEKLLIF